MEFYSPEENKTQLSSKCIVLKQIPQQYILTYINLHYMNTQDLYYLYFWLQ